jgi:hypothetical protein
VAGALTPACFWPARRTRSRGSSQVVHETAPIAGIIIPGARGKDLNPRSSCKRVVERVVHLIFPGSRVTTDQHVVAKQEPKMLRRPSERVNHMRTIVIRRKTQTRSCGRNFRMRPEQNDNETKGPRGFRKGGVRGVVEVVLGEHLPKPTRREEVAFRRGNKLEFAQGTVNISRPVRS